ALRLSWIVTVIEAPGSSLKSALPAVTVLVLPLSLALINSLTVPLHEDGPLQRTRIEAFLPFLIFTVPPITARPFPGGGGGGGALKVAVTLRASLIVTLHAPVPVQ